MIWDLFMFGRVQNGLAYVINLLIFFSFTGFLVCHCITGLYYLFKFISLSTLTMSR